MVRKLLPIFIIFIFLTEKVNAQCPQNIGFEDGTFSKWQCYAGDIGPKGDIYLQPYPAIDGIHNIQSASSQPQLDRYGNFPVVCPNGSKYSVKLGNESADNGAEAMSYTFDVPVGLAFSLILNYAVVLQNPEHKEFEQPKFTMRIYNETDGNYIDCPSFKFVASSDLPGFKKAKVIGNIADVYYKEWSATSINLIGYGSKKMRMEFTTNDCTKGGHFGYAYFDIVENCSGAITGNTYCSGQTSVTLTGPAGFAGYEWFNDEDPSHLIDAGRILKITPAPANGTQYTLKVTPYLGVGCADVLHTTISKIPANFTFNVADTLFVCKGSFADLSTAIKPGGTPGLNLSYYADPLLLSYVNNPKKVTKEGNYYISAISNEGCTNVLPVYLKVLDPASFQFPDIHVTYPAKADLSNAISVQPHTKFQFFSDAAATIPLSTYYAVGAGRYYVKVISDLGCETISPIRVIADPPPPYVISAPTVFTPNSDGINDSFSLTLKGYVTLEKLRIYNRYGSLVFDGKTANWDGTFKGKVVSTGTYYWVFDGNDDYDGSHVKKSGAITVIK